MLYRPHQHHVVTFFKSTLVLVLLQLPLQHARSCEQVNSLFFARTNHSWVADYYATSVFGFDFANLWLKRVKGVLLKLIIIQLLS
jgi:hypothetical protein